MLFQTFFGANHAIRRVRFALQYPRQTLDFKRHKEGSLLHFLGFHFGTGKKEDKMSLFVLFSVPFRSFCRFSFDFLEYRSGNLESVTGFLLCGA